MHRVDFQTAMFIKGVVSDSNDNIFLWHESEDIKDKRVFFPQNSVLIPILCLQVMHDYVHWHCSIDYCVKFILINKNLC